MMQKRAAPGFALLFTVAIVLFYLLSGDDEGPPQSIEIERPPAGGLYASIALALQEVPEQDARAWSRSWCHPTACPDDAARDRFLEAQASPQVADLPRCVTDRRTLFVFNGWTGRSPTGEGSVDHVVIDCRPVGQALHVQARQVGTSWKVTALAWEPLPAGQVP